MKVRSLKDLVFLLIFISTKAFAWCVLSFTIVSALMFGGDLAMLIQTLIGLVLLGISDFSLMRLLENRENSDE